MLSPPPNLIKQQIFLFSFDFTGGLNLTRFFTLAQQNGLNVLLRPGPYICGEWENGGLPWWLLNYDGIEFRRYETKYAYELDRSIYKNFKLYKRYPKILQHINADIKTAVV